MTDGDSSNSDTTDPPWKYSLDDITPGKSDTEKTDLEIIKSLLIILATPFVTPYIISIIIHWVTPTAPSPSPTTLLLPTQTIPYLTPTSAVLIAAYFGLTAIALKSAFQTVKQAYFQTSNDD